MMKNTQKVFVAAVIILVLGCFLFSLEKTAEFEMENKHLFFQSKEGYVVEVEFINGILFDETIVHYDDGEMVILMGLRTEIPEKRVSKIYWRETMNGNLLKGVEQK